MGTKMIEITHDEAEDIRFALGKLAEINETAAEACRGDIDKYLFNVLTDQCERMRALAKRVSE